MQVSATSAAIKAYAQDLAARPGNDAVQHQEAQALEALLGAFKGFLGKPFTTFSALVVQADTIAGLQEPEKVVLISDALPALERLVLLMAEISTAQRRKDLQSLIKLLRGYESVSVVGFVNAVQSARRGPPERPTMSLSDLKRDLDASLGDDEKFNPILKQLRLLSEADFAEVAKTALRVPFKTKKQGLERLTKLHKTTRAHRRKEEAAGDRSAA